VRFHQFIITILYRNLLEKISTILNSLNPNLENTAGRHYVLKYHSVEKITLAILKVLGLK